MPIIVNIELALKAFEFANTLLPMTTLSMFAIARFKASERSRFWNTYLPWALTDGLQSKEIINNQRVLEGRTFNGGWWPVALWKELRIARPPDLRNVRRPERHQWRSSKKMQARTDKLTPYDCGQNKEMNTTKPVIWSEELIIISHRNR